MLHACAFAPGGPTSPAATPGDGLAAGAQSIPSPGASRAPAPAGAPGDASRPPPFEGESQVVKDPLRGLAKIDRTVPPDDLWDRIRRGFAVQDLDSALVRENTTYYPAPPDYLQRVFDHTRLYRYHTLARLLKP